MQKLSWTKNRKPHHRKSEKLWEGVIQAKRVDLGIARDLETSELHVEVID
jgi:hypothetical protein